MEALSYCQLMERCLAAEARVVELESGKVGNALLEREKHHVEVVRKLTEHIAELTAENVALKNFIYNDCMVYKDFMGELDDADKHKPETPATDRFYAEAEACGVEKFAKYIALYNSDAEWHAVNFAQQLRESAK